MKKSVLSACAIVALAGTSAGAQVIGWASAIDGDWNNSANWIGANIPNAVGEDAVLGLIGPYIVETFANFSYGSLSITNPDATLHIGSNRTMTLNSGSLFNDGTVIVNPTGTGFNAHLSFASDATITGTGSILLNAQIEPNDAQILGNAFTITHLDGHTIHGSGNITGAMTNSGTIVADIPGGVELRLSGTMTQTATGIAGADGGTLLLGNGSVITGGQLTTLNGGKVEVQNTATIGDLINSGDLDIPGQGWYLLLNDSIVNDGTININSNSNGFNAHLRFDVAATIAGTGKITMVSNGDLGDAQILTNGAFDGTIGANQTVEGSGLITGANSGTIVNLGTINGNDPAVGLGLAGNHSGDGTYQSDDGLIELRNGLILDGGTFDSTGAGIIDMTTGGVVTLSNITNLGQMGIRGQGGSISLLGPMTNNGTLTINSNNNGFNAHLRFDASAEINGNGLIQMVAGTSDLGDAQLFTNGVFNGIIGANQTVAGSGIIDGRSGGTIVNNGIINGNHAAVDPDPAVALELWGNHDGNGGGIYRSDDGILGLRSGLVLDGGTFDSTGAGIIDMTTGGVVTLSNITNLGQMGIRGQGGSISLLGPMTNNGTLTINSNNNGFNAHLRFDANATIDGNGTIRMQTAGSSGDAQIYTNGLFTATIGTNQMVAGSGIIDGRLDGTIVNHGMISADDPTAALELRGNHFGDSIGIYNANDGVLALTGGLVLDHGVFSSSGTGIIDMTTGGTATLSRITNTGTMGIRGQGGTIELVGPFTNNGTILINSNDNIFNARIRFLDATIIDGTGTIDMFVAGTDFGDAQILNDQGFIGTIGEGQTITGSGRLQGEMNMDGTLDPGSTHRRFDIDTLHLSATSAMVADLGGLLGGEFDRLLLGGSDAINLDGTLTVNLDAGYTPVFGDSWDIIDGGTIVGSFATTHVPNAPIGQVYRVIYEPSRVFVVLTCDADYTGDGVLNFFDVSKFLTLFSAQDPEADINGDGSFNFFDISAFLQIFSVICK